MAAKIQITNNWQEKKKIIQKHLPVLIFLGLNLFFILSRITPYLHEINPNDGAKYIESGRLLFTWGLRDLAWGPLVACVYAPLNLIIGNSLNWFLLTAWGGNIILFILLWLSFYMLATQLKRHVNQHVILGFLFSTTVYFVIIENQSDALFLPFSIFALINLIKYSQKQRIKHIWLAAIFVALGIFSRVETILLLIPLVFFSIRFNKHKNKIIQLVLASLLPTIIFLLIFVGINQLIHGHPNLGLGNKSFDSFQMNNAFLQGSKNHQAFLRGEEIFGNHQGSALRAAINNPLALGERALANVLRLPEFFIEFFGSLHGLIVLLFSIIGLYKLFADKARDLLLLLFVWPLHAFVSLIFLPRHIIPQISYVIIILCCIGVTHFFSKQVKFQLSLGFFLVSLLLLVLGVATQNKPLFSTGILLASVGGLHFFLFKVNKNHGFSTPLMVLLIGTVIFGNAFLFPAKPIGRGDDERAVHQIQLSLPMNSKILVPTPTYAIAAKMTAVELPTAITDVDQLFSVLSKNDVGGIYVDNSWPSDFEFIMAMINRYPESFEKVYAGETKEIYVFLVNK